MATALANFVKHLKLAIRQLDQLKQEESYVNEEKSYDFVDTTLSLVSDLTQVVRRRQRSLRL